MSEVEPTIGQAAPPTCGARCGKKGPDILDLLASAECVLRGDQVKGPFACIADPDVRRAIASDLLTRDQDEHWTDRVVPGFRSNAEAQCLSATPEKQRGSKAQERESHGPFDNSACWQLFHFGWAVDSTRRRHRKLAADQFPWAMRVVVRTAHGLGPESQARAAWAVIDGVDRGEPAVELLMQFLGRSCPALSASLKLQPRDLDTEKRYVLACAMDELDGKLAQLAGDLFQN